MRRYILSALVAFSLVSCGRIESAERAVFTAKTAFEASLIVAVAYASLPRCSDTQLAPCSDRELVKKANTAAQLAATVLASAEQVVRRPDVPENVAKAQALTAKTAVAQFLEVTAEMEGAR